MQSKGRKLINMLFYHETWNIMIIKNHSAHEFPVNTLDILNKTIPKQLKKIYTFQADPFIIEKNNKVYIFYEAFRFRNSKGVLRCRILDAELTELADVKLEGFDNLKCHLSFPFLFHYDNQLFMIPESSEKNCVILFQSIDFPVRWKKIKVLVSDVALTDNVFFPFNGHLYLLSTTIDGKLTIHMADRIDGPWQKITPALHVCNHHHRGAGLPHRINNKMYFLTQECTPENYGKSVYIKELTSLSISVFTERMISQVNVNINCCDGFHTLNLTGNYITYDIKKNKFSFFAIFKKILYKSIVKYRKMYLIKCH
ncbi:hypothetical protein JD793_004300 [Citrobacter braakii]|nr:hypothetical protein [Citrobacter braakii]